MKSLLALALLVYTQLATAQAVNATRPATYREQLKMRADIEDMLMEGRVFHLEVNEEAWSNNNQIIAEEISNGVVYMSGPVVFDNLEENKKVTQLCDFSYFSKTGAITHETECWTPAKQDK